MSRKNFALQIFPTSKDFPLHSVEKTDIIYADIFRKFRFIEQLKNDHRVVTRRASVTGGGLGGGRLCGEIGSWKRKRER